MALVAAQVGALPWPWVPGLAVHNRLLFSTFDSPVPSFFIMFKLFHFAFLPPVHHILKHCGGSHCRLAMQLAGP